MSAMPRLQRRDQSGTPSKPLPRTRPSDRLAGHPRRGVSRPADIPPRAESDAEAARAAGGSRLASVERVVVAEQVGDVGRVAGPPRRPARARPDCAAIRMAGASAGDVDGERIGIAEIEGEGLVGCEHAAKQARFGLVLHVADGEGADGDAPWPLPSGAPSAVTSMPAMPAGGTALTSAATSSRPRAGVPRRRGWGRRPDRPRPDHVGAARRGASCAAPSRPSTKPTSTPKRAFMSAGDGADARPRRHGRRARPGALQRGDHGGDE